VLHDTRGSPGQDLPEAPELPCLPFAGYTALGYHPRNKMPKVIEMQCVSEAQRPD